MPEVTSPVAAVMYRLHRPEWLERAGETRSFPLGIQARNPLPDRPEDGCGNTRRLSGPRQERIFAYVQGMLLRATVTTVDGRHCPPRSIARNVEVYKMKPSLCQWVFACLFSSFLGRSLRGSGSALCFLCRLALPLGNPSWGR